MNLPLMMSHVRRQLRVTTNRQVVDRTKFVRVSHRANSVTFHHPNISGSTGVNSSFRGQVRINCVLFPTSTVFPVISVSQLAIVHRAIIKNARVSCPREYRRARRFSHQFVVFTHGSPSRIFRLHAVRFQRLLFSLDSIRRISTQDLQRSRAKAKFVPTITIKNGHRLRFSERVTFMFKRHCFLRSSAPIRRVMGTIHPQHVVNFQVSVQYGPCKHVIGRACNGISFHEGLPQSTYHRRWHSHRQGRWGGLLRRLHLMFDGLFGRLFLPNEPITVRAQANRAATFANRRLSGLSQDLTYLDMYARRYSILLHGINRLSHVRTDVLVFFRMSLRHVSRATYLYGSVYLACKIARSNRQLYLFSLSVRANRRKASLFRHRHGVRAKIRLRFFPLHRTQTSRRSLNVQVFLLRSPNNMMRQQANDQGVFFRIQSVFLNGLGVEQAAANHRGQLTFHRLFFRFFNFITNHLRHSLHRFRGFGRTR